MVSAQTIYIATVGLSSLLPWLLIRPVLRNREKPGATPLLLVLLGSSFWSLLLGLNTAAATTLPWFVTANLTLLVINISSIGVFLMAGEYTGILQPRRSVVAVLALLTLTIQVLAWTNSVHHLLYPPLDTTPIEEITRFPDNSLVMLVLHGTGSYVLLIVSFVFLIADVFTSHGIRRKQSVALSLSIGAPFVPNALSVSGVISFDITPLGFIITVFFIAWALFRADLLDVVPVGRTRAVESMDDPVVILDQNQHVVDCNPAARDLFDAGSDWEGMAAPEFFALFPDHYERFQQTAGVETEISITKRSRRRHFDLSISPIYGSQDDQQGTLIVLREITPLKEREQELDLLRQVQSRVLRHNIRNDLGVVKSYTQLFADELDGQHAEMAARVISSTDDLISVSKKARSVEKLVEQDQSPTTLDLTATLQNVVWTHRTEFPSVTFELEGPETATVETIPAVEMAIDNLVENAAEHNDSDDPAVEVTVTETEEHTSVTITDNGPGIPNNELSVLEEREETALQHGSGVGLWVVNWVVQNSTASVEFDSDKTGSTVTVRVPCQDRPPA